MTDIGIKIQTMQDAEFILLEVMDCCLVVYQPYRPLQQFVPVRLHTKICSIRVVAAFLGYASVGH